MSKSNLITISFTYLFSVLLLLLTFKGQLTIFILLQNSLFFLFISYLIFKFFSTTELLRFSFASKITYIRLTISIVLLTASIASSRDAAIFRVFYNESTFIILALISLLLDGLDGFIARRYNDTSKFGELFDQESDNFLMFVLSISLYINKDIGLYVFLIPAYRYIFITLMTKYSWLKNTLPDSILRKSVCVMTTLLMIISHEVYFNEFIFNFIINLALFIITFSFSKDIIWLYRNKYEKD